MTQIFHESTDQDRRKFNLANDGVAAAAQQPTNRARVMVVIDHQFARGRVTEQAPPTLRIAHRVNLGRRKPVLAHQSGAEILRLRGFRVVTSPFAEALVPTFPVGRPVLTVPRAHAHAALGPRTTPGREGGFGELVGADSASDHVATMPCGTDTPLDQPCHADVLLELANG